MPPDANALARAVARYHAGCLRVIGAQNVALRDVRTTKKAALCCDLGRITDTEEVLSGRRQIVRAPVRPPQDAMPGAFEEYERQMIIWERLRELTAKATIEAHAKEVVYGSPLLAGYLPKRLGGNAEPVLAPLLMQTVTLQVTDLGEIVITTTDEPPRFNTAVWRDTIRADDVAQIVGLGVDAQADLAAGYDPARVKTLLTGIGTVFTAVAANEPDLTLAPWPELRDTRERRDQSSLALHDGAVLFLANRASPYLLHDLETIADHPSAVVRKDRPLQVLLTPPSTEERPELESRSLEEVVYPFPSNVAQRQVVDALGKNRIVVVQGPPGNGKSLTIANLVAHLVANGQSVLVTSHKNQALTVVRDKLESIGQRFLYASLIGDGMAAKRELQRQIADVKAFAGAANRTYLIRQLGEIEQRRADSGRRYRDLRDDFMARAEPQQAEAARLFEQFRNVATLPVSDEALDGSAQTAAAHALRRLDELSREHQAVWSELRRGPLAATDTHDAEIKTLSAFIDTQDARLAAANDPRVGELVEAWHPIVDADPRQIDVARTAIDEIRAALAPSCTTAAAERAAASALSDATALLKDVERGTEALRQAFADARELAEHRTAVKAQIELRAQVRQRHECLSTMMRRRGARKWLDEHAPGCAGLDAETVERWATFWDRWERLRTLADGLAGGLRAELPATFAPDDAQRVISRAEQSTARARAILAAQQAALSTRVSLPLVRALDATNPTQLDEVLLVWSQALAAAHADRTGNELKVAPELRFLDGLPGQVDALMDQGRHDEAEPGVSRLKAALAALPALDERSRLLDGPLRALPGAAEAVELAGETGAPAPEFLFDLDRALSVHAAVRRFEEIANDPTTRALAEVLSELTAEVMQDAQRLLGAKIQDRILKGFLRPSFLSSLEAFRKAVGGSPKRFERFEELKNSPEFDIDVLTDVFPCWIMRPEDACRVFPLRPDVFDVVIFDEASQCNPDQVLPLFARSERALIVGDDKQLSNEDLRRTLSSSANVALIRQAGLDKLDSAALFDQTQNSLLELTSARQQASVLLNEHFRCRPEIVAFSNHHFYGDTLTVIRDREDDHGLGPALILREVEINPQLAVRGAKVNYGEAKALLEELKRRLDDPRYADMTFGVLSLFREQVEHLELAIEHQIPQNVRDRHRLICSTVDGFQGDERDVILYSWRYTAADHPAVFAFTNGGAGEQRTNVALTRARHQAIHFLSVPVEQYPASAVNVTGYLRHAADPERLLSAAEQRAHREPAGPARRALAQALEADGLRVIENYVACGVSVDLLVRDDDNAKRVAVFVDADRAIHRPPDTPERVDQHALLERAGWTVVRAPACEALPDVAAAQKRVRDALAASPALRRLEREEQARGHVAIHDAELPIPDSSLLDLDMAAEDRADYHWDAPSVERRLAAGEDVFQSGLERDLYTALARIDGLTVVPQWPSRNKHIDLVVTDRDGRRIAVEADGSQHHETDTGELIPEDLERQALLEEAGWSFCRVRHADFAKDAEYQVERILDALAQQPMNPDLARLVWTDQAVEEALSAPVEMVAAEPEDLREPEIISGDAPDAAPLTATLQTAPERGDASIEADEPGDEPIAIAVATPAIPGADTDGRVEIEAADDLPGGEDNSTDDHAPAAPLITPAASEHEAAPTISSNAAGSAAELDVPSIEDAPLGLIALQVTEVVIERGAIDEDDLADAYAERYGIRVPRTWHRTIKRFAWTAKGMHNLDLDGQTWVPGDRAPQPDARYGEWTFRKMVNRAAEMLRHDDDPFEDLLAEVYGGTRIPKLVMSLVGSAINQAKRDRQLRL